MFLRTRSVLNDERVNKEVNSLGPLVNNVTIFASEFSNKYSSFSRDNAFFNVIKLFSFKILGRLSVLELFFRAIPTLLFKGEGAKKVIWLHDPILFILLPFIFILRKLKVVHLIVWDHHELPPSHIVNSSFWRGLLGWFARHVDINIQANRPRAEFFNQYFLKKSVSEIFIIRNYPDNSKFSVPENFDLDGPFIYVQSGYGNHRCWPSLFKSLRESSTLPIVFAGAPEGKFDYSGFSVPVIELGRISPQELKGLFYKAAFTIVLYQERFGINNFLCEPNRLFHALNSRLPILCGYNPTMSDEVAKFKAGIILEDDGSNPIYLSKAISQMCREYEKYNYEVDDLVSWHIQAPIFNEIIRRIP